MQRVVGEILDSDSARFQAGRLGWEEGKITSLEWGLFKPEPDDICSPDSFIVPGFIELQLNGGLGFDFTGQPEAVAEVAAALPQWGVTSFLPTVITSPEATYLKAFKTIGQLAGTVSGAQVLGIHLEGPFINPKFKGAHNSNWMQPLSNDKLQAVIEAGPLKLLTLAPELPNSGKAIAFLQKKGIIVSLGHSAASFEEAQQGFQAGARYVTHLFNAMPPLHHRKPGLPGAALIENEVTCGIIADGIHLHPTLLKLIYNAKGSYRISLVSDAMAGMGMPPGKYDLSGQTVLVDETSARLDDPAHTLAGSILTLDRALNNMQKWTGCSLGEAVRMVTTNPARLLGLSAKGKLSPGFDADLVILKKSGSVERTFAGGIEVYKKN